MPGLFGALYGFVRTGLGTNLLNMFRFDYPFFKILLGKSNSRGQESRAEPHLERWLSHRL
jgi:hypothetical protein